MTHVTYKIVEHDGGWAYTVNGVLFRNRFQIAPALAAAHARRRSSGCRAVPR
jgi:hypothetical protein